MDQLKVGEHLKELRKDKGVTQEALSEALGVSRRTVSRWETGTNLPDIDIILALSDYFRVDVREIMTGKSLDGTYDEDVSAQTAILTAEYDNSKQEKIFRRLHILYAVYAILMFLCMISYIIPSFPNDNETVRYIRIFVCLGTSFLLVHGAFITKGKLLRICKLKEMLINRFKT